MKRRTLYLLASIIISFVVPMRQIFSQPILIPDDFEWYSYITYLNNPTYNSIISDSDGNIYIGGFSLDGTDCTRFLQKISRTGVPQFEEENPYNPWWQGTSDNSLGIFTTKMVLNESETKLYVLFASKHVLSTKYNFFLTRHDTDTGEKSTEFNSGYSIYVGTSDFIESGLSLDTDGNVFVAIQDNSASVGYGLYPRSIIIQKYNGTDGTDISPSTNRIGTDTKHYILLDINASQTEDKIFFVSRTESFTSGIDSDDISITSYDTDMNWIQNKRLSFEISAPDDESELHHPWFSSSYLDESNNLFIGGYFTYDREITFPENYGTYRYYHPVVQIFDIDLNELHRYVSESTMAVAHETSTYLEEVTGIIKKGPGSNTAIFNILPYSCNRILGIRTDGTLKKRILVAPIKAPWNISNEYNYPESTNCYYTFWPRIFDFTYSNNKLYEVGNSSAIREASSSTSCPTRHEGVIAIAYHHLLNIADIRLINFDWRRYAVYAERIRELIDWPPRIVNPPQPGPIPPYDIYARTPSPEFKLSLSTSNDLNKIPGYLIDLYRFDVKKFQDNNIEFPDSISHNLKVSINQVPINEKKKVELISSIDKFNSTLKASEKEFIDVGTYYRFLNSVDLNWRIPPLSQTKVERSESKTLNFNGLMWIDANNISKEGKCLLNVESGLPAFASGFTPLWPAVTYNIESDFSTDQEIDISIYYRGYKSLDESYSLRILEWDGNKYLDITTEIIPEQGIIKGSTKSLRSYVLMSQNINSKDLSKD